jgi:hypothetical protein
MRALTDRDLCNAITVFDIDALARHLAALALEAASGARDQGQMAEALLDEWGSLMDLVAGGLLLLLDDVELRRVSRVAARLLVGSLPRSVGSGTAEVFIEIAA